MAYINPSLPAVGDTDWGLPLNTAVETIVAQVNSHDDVITALPDTYATLADLASGGGGGTTTTGTLTVTVNSDGTTTATTTGTGYTATNNGDGTSSLSGPTVFDNGDGTTGASSGSATSGSGGTTALPTTRTLTGTAYTLALPDAGNIIENGGTSVLIVTVPSSTTAGFLVGTVIEFFNYATGSITITPASGVTIRSPNGLRVASLYASAALRKRSANEWVLAGYTAI